MSPSHNYIVSTGQHVSMSSCHHIMSPYHVTMSSSPTYHHVNVGILHLQFNEHQPNFLPLSLTMKAKASINYYSVRGEYMYLSVRRGCKIGMMLVGWSDVCSCADCYPGCVLGLPGGSFGVRLGANTFPPEGYHLAFKGLPPSPSPPSRPPPCKRRRTATPTSSKASEDLPFGNASSLWAPLVSLCAIWVPTGVGCVRLTTQL